MAGSLLRKRRHARASLGPSSAAAASASRVCFARWPAALSRAGSSPGLFSRLPACFAHARV
eukprot:3326312-Rhodomonas_salina.1